MPRTIIIKYQDDCAWVLMGELGWFQNPFAKEVI
jgi:hypothetical protein